MNICSVAMGGWNIIFESSKDLAPALLRIAQTTEFFGLGIFPQMSLGEYRVVYEESDTEVSVRYSSQTVIIRAPWNVVCGGETLLYAALPFIELQRQTRGYVTIHAAAVYNNSGTSTLILGKSGSGKTITALSLCRYRGARLMGNDLVVIGSEEHRSSIKIHSGTKFITLRYESILRNMPDLLHLFPDKNEDSWLRKVSVLPKQANIGLYLGDAPLANVFMVHVDETKNDIFVKSANNLVTRLYINENFSRYIRGTCLAVLGRKLEHLGYIPSFDSEALFAHRVVLIERLFTEYAMVYVSGPLEKVVEYVASQ